MLAKMQSNRNSHSLLVGMENGTTTLEDSLVVSYKAKDTLTTSSGNHTPWYLPKGIENLCPYKKLHVEITKTWKQPRCPSVGEWIYKLWYIQTMKYYSVLNRNELSSHEKIWRNFKCVLLS